MDGNEKLAEFREKYNLSYGTKKKDNLLKYLFENYPQTFRCSELYVILNYSSSRVRNALYRWQKKGMIDKYKDKSPNGQLAWYYKISEAQYNKMRGY